ncbi:MAG: ACT domain-containing protein [Candidatus Micrarchaeota archaeon]|nr:ACT domain-containing protein [Candidatus Micrarchaeota archaeon]
MTKKSISTAVSEILDDMQYLHLPFTRGLVNCSGVARLITPLIEERTGAKPGMDAVIVAVRRYARTLKKSGNPTLESVIMQCSAVLRTGLAGFHIKNWHNSHFMAGLSALLTGEVDWDSGEKVYVSQRSGEMYICSSTKFMPKIIALATKPPTELAHYQENLSLITINHPPAGHSTPGVFAFFINLLAQANINVYEIFSTYRKFSLLIEEENAPKAYELINKAIVQNKKLFGHQKHEPVPAIQRASPMW